MELFLLLFSSFLNESDILFWRFGKTIIRTLLRQGGKKVKDKIQKFGGAMFTPVMLLSFSGIILAITIIFQNPIIMGPIAE